MKKLITEKELANIGTDTFTVEDHMIIAPSARDYASRKGLRLLYPQRDATTSTQDSPMDQAIREIVTAELGRADRNVIQAVRAGVSRAVDETVVESNSPPPPAPAESPAVHAARHSDGVNRAVLSITGLNRTGILGTFTGIISKFGCDIVNVSQTVVSGFFTMVLIVDLGPLAKQNITFEKFRENVLSEAKQVGVEAMLMHEDVLKAMHRV